MSVFLIPNVDGNSSISLTLVPIFDPNNSHEHVNYRIGHIVSSLLYCDTLRVTNADCLNYFRATSIRDPPLHHFQGILDFFN